MAAKKTPTKKVSARKAPPKKAPAKKVQRKRASTAGKKPKSEDASAAAVVTPVAIYAGSFDPVTNGHVDLIRRASRVFPKVTVAVAYNPNKGSGMFTPDERCEMIRESLADLGDRVVADKFSGLLVDYAKGIGDCVLVRGLRAVSDFEFEFQMTSMNRHLAKEIETVFLMAGEQHFYTSSSLVREVATFGGDVTALVPPPVHRRLQKKLKL